MVGPTRRGWSQNADYVRCAAFADPDGKRIGSGGSTFYVLHQLLERNQGNFNKTFKNKRILVLHSGGDSRRLIAYAAIGKIFTPLPTKNYYSIFDIVLSIFSQLPEQKAGQVIVGSGDVVLNFNPAFVQFKPGGITGVAYPEEIDVASRHGVYVIKQPYKELSSYPVDDFLQKPESA